jgi:probable DNA metabolism protein
MPYRTDIAYLYDGSFDGLMCCVFESYAKKELPEFIFTPEEEQITLYEIREIECSQETSSRVISAVKGKISSNALEFIKKAFYTALPGKELHILKFLRKGFREGGKILDMLTDDTVSVLSKAVSYLGRESELYRGFVRFSEIGGVLVSVIEPKNFVLPFLADHFCDRLPEETYVIYDKTHSAMLLGEKGKSRLGYVQDFEPGEADIKEKGFRRLWQSFYEAIGIQERYNPGCRISHMPKRYWPQLTEFRDRETAPLPDFPEQETRRLISGESES